MKQTIFWDGNADTANKFFGECYGQDWEYVENSSDIIVNGKVIHVGEEIKQP